MKLIAAILLTLMVCGIACADQEITIKVPDTFTEADNLYVAEMASVGIQRILEKPLIPAVKDVDAAKLEIDRLRKANGLTAKFEVKEIAEINELIN